MHFGLARQVQSACQKHKAIRYQIYDSIPYVKSKCGPGMPRSIRGVPSSECFQNEAGGADPWKTPGSVQFRLERLKKADEAMKQATARNYCAQLMENVRSFGDVRSHLLILDQMVPLLRSLRTERAQPTVASMASAQPLLNTMLELIKELGDLEQLKRQMGVLQELEVYFHARADLSEIHGKLINDDPSPKLDSLKQLLDRFKKFQTEVLAPGA